MAETSGIWTLFLTSDIGHSVSIVSCPIEVVAVLNVDVVFWHETTVAAHSITHIIQELDDLGFLALVETVILGLTLEEIFDIMASRDHTIDTHPSNQGGEQIDGYKSALDAGNLLSFFDEYFVTLVVSGGGLLFAAVLLVLL